MNPIGFRTDYEEWQKPVMDTKTRDAAIQAVNEAIETHYRQPWYSRTWGGIRFGLFWAGYVARRTVWEAMIAMGADRKRWYLKLGL